jgi:hypothetical protein
MSLLKNRNNEFERKLQEQLDDTEFKPSESLWGRIDREVNRPEFEQRVEGKIGNYQLKPYPETWEQIEAQLPPPAKSRRRWGALWVVSLSVLFAGAFVGGYLLSEKQVNHQSAEVIVKQAEVAIERNENKEQTASQVPSSSENNKERSYTTLNKQVIAKATVPAVSKKVDVVHAVETIRANPSKGITEVNTQVNTSVVGSVTPPTILPPSHAVVNNQNPEQKSVSSSFQTAAQNLDTSANSIAQVEEKKPTDQLANKQEAPPVDTPRVGQLTKIEPISDSAAVKIDKVSTPSTSASKISLSVLAGAHLGYMILKDPNGQFAENIALRKQVESSELDWSGGFLLDYKLSDKWLVSSGIQFTHLSMSMTFGTTTTSRYPTIEPGGQLIVMDSVTQSGPNNLRIKYSWNEIPLLFTYRFNTQKRLSLETKFGVSYAIISVVDAAMIAQNNIGVYNLKSQDAFPGFNNLFFAQAYAGIAYRLNESVTLTAMPYAKVSLNNMVSRENWVKQYPLLTGLSFGLRKSF